MPLGRGRGNGEPPPAPRAVLRGESGELTEGTRSTRAGLGEPLQGLGRGWGSPPGERERGARGAPGSGPPPRGGWAGTGARGGGTPGLSRRPPFPPRVPAPAAGCRRCRWAPRVAPAAPSAACRWPEDPPRGVPRAPGGSCGAQGVFGRGWEVLGGCWVKGAWGLQPALTFAAASWHLQRKTGGVTLESRGSPRES